MVDVYGDGDTFRNGFESFYPDDLENLIYFIRQIIKSALGLGPSVSAVGSVQPKSTSFSSFAQKSSFAKKKAGSSIAQKNTQISTQETTI